MGVVEGGEGLLEPPAPAAVEIHDGADAGRVHLGKVVRNAIGREGLLAAAEVVVDVDDREGRLGDLGRASDQHRPGLPVAEFELLDVIDRLRRRVPRCEQCQGKRPEGEARHDESSRRVSNGGPAVGDVACAG